MNNSTWRAILAGTTRDLMWDFSSGELFWHLDFEEKKIDPFNVSLFHAHALAVEEFGKQAPKGSRVILASFTLGSFLDHVCLSPKFEEAYIHSGLASQELFCSSLVSQYLHRLASFLPDEVEPYLSIELSEDLEIAEATLYLCKRRFEHLGLHFVGKTLPLHGTEANIGISLPQDEKWDVSAYKKLFALLEEKKIPFACIPEEYLNEFWEGIDLFIVDPKTISPIGERMIRGFRAAGGEVCSLEEVLTEKSI